MYSNGMRLHAQAPLSDHDGCVAITYRANYRGRSFRRYCCRSVAEPSKCPMDRCHQLHLVGRWCASCYGYSCYLFRAVDLVQIATSSSYRILFPSTRSTRSRCLRHYAIGQGEYAAATENRDTRSFGRADSICCRIFRRFDHVGVWTCMVLLRHRVH